MPKLIPYYLTFRGGLHIGTRGINLEETGVSIPSDTLFSALLDAWQRRYGGSEAFAEPFLSQPPNPPFLLTSAFPRVGKVLFFPMPVDLNGLLKPETLHSRSKQIKRIRYLSQALLEKALGGATLDDDLFPDNELEEPQRGAALQGGGLWLSLSEIEGLPGAFQRERGRRHALRGLKAWASSQVPRVTVSRVTSAANLFHAGRVSFAEGCGLWFGVEWRQPEARLDTQSETISYRQALDLALHMLADAGLGGERSVGYGAFQAQPSDSITLAEPQAGKLAYLLSRYHPRPDELPQALTSLPHTAYQLAAVGGWLNSPHGPTQRRKRLFMLAEGGLVTPPAFPAGSVEDVKPDYENPQGELPHPVYRSGLACAAGWPERPAAEPIHEKGRK